MNIENTENRVLQILASYFNLKINTLTLNTHLFNDLGAHSLEFSDIILILEEEFETEIIDDEAKALCTVNDIVLLIKELTK